MTVAEGSAGTMLPLTSRAVARLPPRLRETYLTPEVKNGSCITQAVGREVRVWIWSDRENIRLSIPLNGFEVRRPYEQSIHRWGINLSRYTADDPGETTLSVVVEDGQAHVEAAIETFETEVMPDV